MTNTVWTDAQDTAVICVCGICGVFAANALGYCRARMSTLDGSCASERRRGTGAKGLSTKGSALRPQATNVIVAPLLWILRDNLAVPDSTRLLLQCFTVLYSTLQYSTVLYSTRSARQYSATVVRILTVNRKVKLRCANGVNRSVSASSNTVRTTAAVPQSE
jgi:hypothetical protein